MTNWKLVRIGCATAALALMVAGSVMALGVNHKNQLTFNRPVALPGVVLPAGSYNFDVASRRRLDVVVVRNRPHEGPLHGLHRHGGAPRQHVENGPDCPR